MYNSQIGQDKWVHSVIGNKKEGYFVELGACDGLYYSNTLFFEKHLKWNGICIEPNPNDFEKLKQNRCCTLSNELAFSESGKRVTFAVSGAGSGILGGGVLSPFTNQTNTIELITTTLGDILTNANAPSVIDYLSLDVEGQEYNILSTFPFDKFTFNCITVEHNEPHVGSENRYKIRSILESNGYIFIKGNDDIMQWNHGPIDDFYIHSSFQPN